jgi:hypothetical protein
MGYTGKLRTARVALGNQDWARFDLGLVTKYQLLCNPNIKSNMPLLTTSNAWVALSRREYITIQDPRSIRSVKRGQDSQ